MTHFHSFHVQKKEERGKNSSESQREREIEGGREFPGSLTFSLHQALNRQVVLAEVLIQMKSASGHKVKVIFFTFLDDSALFSPSSHVCEWVND